MVYGLTYNTESKKQTKTNQNNQIPGLENRWAECLMWRLGKQVEKGQKGQISHYQMHKPRWCDVQRGDRRH